MTSCRDRIKTHVRSVDVVSKDFTVNSVHLSFTPLVVVILYLQYNKYTPKRIWVPWSYWRHYKYRKSFPRSKRSCICSREKSRSNSFKSYSSSWDPRKGLGVVICLISDLRSTWRRKRVKLESKKPGSEVKSEIQNRRYSVVKKKQQTRKNYIGLR